MRSILVFGIATLGLALSALSVEALPLNETGSPHAGVHHRQARPLHRAAPSGPALYEGRAAIVAGPPRRVLGDEGYHHPTDNGYHDPAFSLQQDEIYNGRF
jgi:hypothetical protein